MKKLYKLLRLFWVPRCRHKWVLQRTIKVYKWGGEDMPDFFKKECYCSKCGEWKWFKT
jgi:hypothetical protein